MNRFVLLIVRIFKGREAYCAQRIADHWAESLRRNWPRVQAMGPYILLIPNSFDGWFSRLLFPPNPIRLACIKVRETQVDFDAWYRRVEIELNDPELERHVEDGISICLPTIFYFGNKNMFPKIVLYLKYHETSPGNYLSYLSAA
jgi:hypothetical protein